MKITVTAFFSLSPPPGRSGDGLIAEDSFFNWKKRTKQENIDTNHETNPQDFIRIMLTEEAHSHAWKLL